MASSAGSSITPDLIYCFSPIEHNENIKEKDLITDQIQKDLSNRLSQSRDELLKIKDQMKGILFSRKKLLLFSYYGHSVGKKNLKEPISKNS